MKFFFSFLFMVLGLASLAIWGTAPDMRSEVPVLYWATDPNPARYDQIALFHQWLVDEGHVTPEGGPLFELRLDTASGNEAKKIIQGVSGVAADILDGDAIMFQSIGFIADMTDPAKRLGFDMRHTYAALENSLTVDGRQYGFPCNVSVIGFWANVDTFERYGMPPPPRSWDVETFERIGREFVTRANPPGERRTVFFSSAPRAFQGVRFAHILMRGEGADSFNETLTACTLVDGRFAWVLEKLHQWTYEDQLFPTAADEASFAGEAGYGGAGFSLFNSGNYGMLIIGRYILIRMRELQEPPRLSVSMFPATHFPNAVIGARVASVYAGSPHPELAALFLAFLASEPYNQSIVHTADALPPNPAFTRTEEFLRPIAFPNEWGAHEVPAEAAESIALGLPYSPYIPFLVVAREMNRALEAVMANLMTPTEAAEAAERRINEEMARGLQESPRLREQFERERALQERIDARRAEGQPVPRDWLKNPFHRRYYETHGWLADHEGDATP